MSDEELEEYLRVVEPNFNSHIEKGTIEMSNEYYNLFEERMARLINKNKNLQSKIDKAIEWIEQYEKQIGILGETSKSIVLTDDVVIGNLLDILKKDKQFDKKIK